MNSRKFPFTFIPLENNAAIRKDFLGYENYGLVTSVPGNWVYPEIGEDIYNMELREDDVWAITYPKSGTTWMQHLVWLLLNKLDSSSLRDGINARSPFIERDHFVQKEKLTTELKVKRDILALSTESKDINMVKIIDGKLIDLNSFKVQQVKEMPKTLQRLLKSHLPFELLPPSLLSKNRVVYVARDPRDVIVSYYHHHRLLHFHKFIGDSKTLFNYFSKEQVLYSPYWPHIAQAWQQRDSPNMLFIFYSEMKEDLMSVICRVSTFLGFNYSNEELGTLLQHLSFNNMKSNDEEVREVAIKLGYYKEGEGSFIRAGESGGWKNYFDEDMVEEMNRWMEENRAKFDVPAKLEYFNAKRYMYT